MKEHGLRVFAGGIVLHGDRRPRYKSGNDELEILNGVERDFGKRAKVTGLSSASGRRLELILASAANRFRSIITVTYRARSESWEGDAQRNARIAERSKRDLNRFLSAVRARLGAYVWVQEFQARLLGVTTKTIRRMDAAGEREQRGLPRISALAGANVGTAGAHSRLPRDLRCCSAPSVKPSRLGNRTHATALSALLEGRDFQH